MGIRTPEQAAYAVVDIRMNIDGKMRQLTVVRSRLNGVLYTLWEQGSTTFFDKNGNIILDKNGMPFQGKKL